MTATVADPWRGARKRVMSRLAMSAPVLVMLCVMATALVGGAVMRLADAFAQRTVAEAVQERGDDGRRRA